MKSRNGKLIARIICMILCVCMVTTTLASCSFWDSIFGTSTPDDSGSNDNQGGNTPGGDNPGEDSGNTPGGETETTYHKVQFAVAIEEYKSRVTLPEEKLYKDGTEIQYLPTPAVRDLLFMGWYYDALMTRPVELTDKVSSDLMLYAKVVDTSNDISVIEGVYYHTAYGVETDYTFSVRANSMEEVRGALSLVNISSAGAALVLDEDYNIKDGGDGTYKVCVNYKAGKTYRANLAADLGLRFVVDGIDLGEQVTTLNVLVAKSEVSNLTLSDGLIYIPMADVEMLTDSPNGLVSLSTSGSTVNSGSIGYFSYDCASLKSGDRVAIYEGAIPSERDFGTDNGAVKYLTITEVLQSNVYKYRVSDSKEVLFIPDIIPVAGKTNYEREAKVAVGELDFSSDFYKQLGMNEDTQIEVGDYIAFFDGHMSQDTPVEYAKITEVSRDNEYYYISYTPVSYDEVIASMDIFQTRTNTPELSDEEIEDIAEQVVSDSINSGFVDEAAAYLVDLYVSTNGLETMPNGTTIKYTPKMRANARSGGLYYEITKCEAVPDIKVGDGVLKHFEESDGIRIELVLSFEVEFTIGEDGENKVVIAAEAVFEEEVLISLNVDGGAVWDKAWIFPYVTDYEMNANIDIGTYTGVSVVAKVYTSNGEEKEEEEDDDSFFPDFDLDNIGKGDSYEEKAKNIGEELKKLFELNDNIKEEIEGEEEDDTGNDITEKYAEMMKDANETWIELVKVDIYEYSQFLDQFGILWFNIGVDFVISAQLYIVAGIEVETGVAKRYNFSVALFDRSVKTDVIDLEKAHFSFKFYCMGTAGLKVGFEIEMSLALLSSDVASVGISAELGVSLGIWGYFYYSYEKEAGEEPEIQKAGAMFFELGIYIEVKFKAHLFNIEKLTYNPTLYENLWPIYSVGAQENVFEFEDYTDRELTFVMQGTNSLVLPDYIFRMKYLDLKDGKYYSGKDSGDETPSKSFDDETESRFLIEISDSRFTYDPKTNTLNTTVDVKNMDVADSFEIKIQITYKHGALAFNQEVITREITVQIKNNADYGYIVVALNGPAWLGAQGPSGRYSYSVKNGEAFTTDMLPKINVKDGYKFIKWIWAQNYRDVNDKLWVEGDDFVGLESVERRTTIYLAALWEPQEVEFSVRIFKENVGGAYVYDRTETVKGLAGSEYNLYKLADPGYYVSNNTWGTTYLSYGGSYDLYLGRATKTIRYLNVDGEGGMITTTSKSGASLVPPVVSSRIGYEFVGWADASSGKNPCVMPDTVPYVDGIIIYTALWKPVSDVQYTVKHYVQNANDDGFELYMTEYFTASYKDPVRVCDHVSSAVNEAGFIWETNINPGWRTEHSVELDGSTTLRVYYAREEYPVYYEYVRPYGFFRHGQLVDLSQFEDIPSKKGYRFVGWDINGDNVKDETFIMPKEQVGLVPLWEGVDGTEYKVIHMVQDANTNNYVQAGFTYMYGVTDTTPASESIYSDKYVIKGQFVANYEKASVRAITADKLAVMYAYYDRVDYNVIIKAYDPEGGDLVHEMSVAMPYGRKINNDKFPKLSEFDVVGYKALRYTSSGYTEMPDHDIEVNVVYTKTTAIPFIVNHYVERTDGTFYIYRSETHTNASGVALHDNYIRYRLAELTARDSHFSLNVEMIEETYLNRDGSTVFNLYYVRDKFAVYSNVYKLDAYGNLLEKNQYIDYYRYDERVILHGYYENYEYEKMVDRATGDTYGKYYSWFSVTEEMYVDIYVKPVYGVPYKVNHWLESVDGSGYELYSSYSLTGTHSQTILTSRHEKYMLGFALVADQIESMVLDVDSENVLDIYYSRKVYNVSFYNPYKPEATVTYQMRHGMEIVAPTVDLTVPGYEFVEWKNFTEGKEVTGNTEFRATYVLSTRTPYKVNHYVMGLDGEYSLEVSEMLAGTTNSMIYASDHIHADYSGVGYTLKENVSVKIAPDGSTVLDIYYERESFLFNYQYYAGGKIVNSVGVLVMHGADIPASIMDYEKDYPEYALKNYSILTADGSFEEIAELPKVMGKENITIRVTLEAIGPEVTIIHKVMNVDGETYTEYREEFLAIPFEALELENHLLSSVRVGFTYRIPENNQIPDALKENVYVIYYDRNTYTVDYLSNYSLERITENYIYGATLGTPPVFERPGYIHVGWDSSIPETMPARNISFTTTWQIRESVPVTILHMMTALEGDGYVEVYRETVYYTPELMIYGNNYAKPITGGFYKNAEKKIVAEDGSTEVCIYYTRNEYTVRFTYGDIAGAGEDVAYVLPYGSAIKAPEFEVPGYTLVGWSPELSATVTAEHVTYTAKWEAKETDVVVKHWITDLKGEAVVSETDTISLAQGSIINGETYKKVFEGFTYSSADKNVVVQIGSTTVVNVYYERNSYKVTYTYGDKAGAATEYIVKYGAALPEAPVFSVVGYTFAGWDSELASTMPANDLTYAATWAASTDIKFTVEHYYQNANDDGYTKVETETKFGATGATLNGADYKKALDNAIFERAENSVISADGTSVIKVYYVRATYTLTFTYGDKVGESATYTLRFGQSVSYNPSFALEGYVFAGWDSEIPSVMPAENVTLNATWSAGDGIAYKIEHYLQNANDDNYVLDHTDNRTGVTGAVIDGTAFATLIGNGIILKSAESKAILADGSTVIKIYYDRVSYTVTYTYGSMAGENAVYTVRFGAALPEAPEFSVVGYTFAGWDSKLVSTMPASDLTYTATWTANTDTKFTVEHYYQNANDDGYTKVETETKFGTTGATLNGADYKKALDNAIFERAENSVVLADGTTVVKVYYVRTTYTLTFKNPISNDEVTHSIRFGATLPAAPVFSAQGYTFGGWTDEEGLFIDQLEKEMPAHSLIYTAVFMENEDTPFQIEHYIEQANGLGYDLIKTEVGEGRTGSIIVDPFAYLVYDDGVMYFFERFNSDELIINPDGSTVLKIYYQRVRYTVTFYVVDGMENPIDGIDPITIEFKYGQTITPPNVEVLEGYEFEKYDPNYDTMPDENVDYYYIMWNCLHESCDGDHECDRCYETLECTDSNDDGHCDYGREPNDPDDHRFVDNDDDHICDICRASFTDLCVDENKNGKCDVCENATPCPVNGEDHRDDEVSDHICDDCGVWMSYLCSIEDGRHECVYCYARFYELCTDEDGDCWCDVCMDTVPCVDEDGDSICDVCENQMPCLGHVDEDENCICDYCLENIQWCDEFDDLHRDENHDHSCDYCGLWMSFYCYDWNDDCRCEDCYRPTFCMQETGKNHHDDDGDHICDECGCWMSYVCTDEDGNWVCDDCGAELACYDHIDEDQNAICDNCGVETKCKKNPSDTYHEDYDYDHLCDWCEVWISNCCIDDDYNGYCDECGRVFICEHIDEDEDNYCDRCFRIINCEHESTSEHYCDTCHQKVSDCYDYDGDLWCDECYMMLECHHEGMEEEHICIYCYEYLSDCKDEDGNGFCDLSDIFPHSPADRQ